MSGFQKCTRFSLLLLFAAFVSLDGLEDGIFLVSSGNTELLPGQDAPDQNKETVLVNAASAATTMECPVQGRRVTPSTTRLGIWYWFVAFMLVVFAGFSSGMTVGLMSLDPVQLKVIEVEGTDEQKRGVKMVSSVIKRHHLLLVTLLLANSIAMETLPIFLDRLLPSWAAVVLSVTAILLFGEILPQAFCTGRNQLAIAQASAPIVKALVAVLFLIAWPIAKLLDHLLGHSEAGSALGADEVIVIEDLANKTLKQIMLPMENVFMLESRTKLDRACFDLILTTGHSRVPIYSNSRNNIKGLLLTKSLLTIDPSAGVLAKDLMVNRRPIFASPESNLYDLLNEFQKGHSHIAFVTSNYDEYARCLKAKQDIPASASLMGIATLEDVIEELIQEEIYDEFDLKGLFAEFRSAYGDDRSEQIQDQLLSQQLPRRLSQGCGLSAPLTKQRSYGPSFPPSMTEPLVQRATAPLGSGKSSRVLADEISKARRRPSAARAPEMAPLR